MVRQGDATVLTMIKTIVCLANSRKLGEWLNGHAYRKHKTEPS
jgi:hypothetical protein